MSEEKNKAKLVEKLKALGVEAKPEATVEELKEALKVAKKAAKAVGAAEKAKDEDKKDGEPPVAPPTGAVTGEAPKEETKKSKAKAEPELVLKKGKFSLLRTGDKFEVRDALDRVVATEVSEDEGRKLVSDFNRV